MLFSQVSKPRYGLVAQVEAEGNELVLSPWPDPNCHPLAEQLAAWHREQVEELELEGMHQDQLRGGPHFVYVYLILTNGGRLNPQPSNMAEKLDPVSSHNIAEGDPQCETSIRGKEIVSTVLSISDINADSYFFASH